MECTRTSLLLSLVGILGLLAHPAAFGQASGAPRTLPSFVTAVQEPAITILAASTGAVLRSLGSANASLDLGRVSYFKGTSASGASSTKTSNSLVITTRFILRVDCPGPTTRLSQVSVSMSRLDASPSHGMAIDGISLGTAEQTLVPSMPCGSAGEHRLDVEVPVSTLAGAIGSTIAFVATLRK